MAKRRANGEGSIRKRSDGRWEGRYTAGRNPETGKPVYKNVLGKTQAEVKAKLKAAIESSADIDVMKAEYVKRRDYMVERINSIDGLSCRKPSGAFYIFMNVKELLGKKHYGKTIHTASELCDDILDRALVALVPEEELAFAVEISDPFLSEIGVLRVVDVVEQ